MAKKTDVEVWLPMDAIDLDDEMFCFRMDLFVEKLAVDIAENGQDFPVVVRPKGERHQLICGFRRVTALKKLGRDRVRAVVRTLSEQEAWRLAWAENEARASYSPVDRAHAVAKAQLAGRSLELTRFGGHCSAFAEEVPMPRYRSPYPREWS